MRVLLGVELGVEVELLDELRLFELLLLHRCRLRRVDDVVDVEVRSRAPRHRALGNRRLDVENISNESLDFRAPPGMVEDVDDGLAVVALE